MELKDLKQGDFVVDKNGSRRKVLGVCGEVYFLSHMSNYTTYGGTCTQKDLENYGYKYYVEPEPEPIVKMTVAQAAEKLGLKPEQLHIIKGE